MDKPSKNEQLHRLREEFSQVQARFIAGCLIMMILASVFILTVAVIIAGAVRFAT